MRNLGAFENLGKVDGKGEEPLHFVVVGGKVTCVHFEMWHRRWMMIY